ncbi:hypothetical protein Dimus_006295 [Dionaea muscipula]
MFLDASAHSSAILFFKRSGPQIGGDWTSNPASPPKLIGDVHHVNGPHGREIVPLSKIPDSLEAYLDADALVVPGTSSEDLAIGGTDGGERRVEPLFGLGGDGVDAGGEEVGGAGRGWSSPGEEEDRLIGSEVEGQGMEVGDGAYLGFEEGDGGGVVWVRVGAFMRRYCLESGDGVVKVFVLSLVGFGETERGLVI